MGDINIHYSRSDISSGCWTPWTKLAPDSLLVKILALKAWMEYIRLVSSRILIPKHLPQKGSDVFFLQQKFVVWKNLSTTFCGKPEPMSARCKRPGTWTVWLPDLPIVQLGKPGWNYQSYQSTSGGESVIHIGWKRPWVDFRNSEMSVFFSPTKQGGDGFVFFFKARACVVVDLYGFWIWFVLLDDFSPNFANAKYAVFVLNLTIICIMINL